MSDIVERLRRRYFSPVAVFRNPDGPEAADEIERLQTKAQKDAREMLAAVENAEAEIERLRAALRRALHLHDMEQAERPTPNVPAWVEDARALLTEGGR